MTVVTEVGDVEATDVTPAPVDDPRPSRPRRFRTAVAQRVRTPWSLRARLLAAVVSLSLVAIVVVSAATYFALGSYLRDRLDHQLEQSQGGATRFLLSAPNTDLNGRTPGLLESETAASLYTTNGTAIAALNTVQLPFHAVVAGPPDPRTVRASNGHRYRVVETEILVNGTPVVVVYGLPISQVDNVLHRLLLLEIAVGGGALILLFLGGTALVRVGLRPLDKMGETAEKIADGDLSQRVPTTGSRTEVGRLGNSLNTMLTTIEDEIDQRTASEERLRRFISDASHELRTPLTSIRGYAELFRRGAVDRPEDLALAMRRIESEAGRMGGLVEDLLLLARLDEGRPLERSRVDLAELARDAAHDAGVIAPDRESTVTIEGDAVVFGDDARLRQVLANLTRNVVSHTPAGSPFGIRVRGGSEVVRLEVWDRGPGLDAEAQAKVFDRFWRADPSRVRDSAYAGAGLGLSIVAALVGAHGGTVIARATPGGGATFIVELPRGHAAAPSTTLD
jgi:two-component system OmpR family sensor kinase